VVAGRPVALGIPPLRVGVLTVEGWAEGDGCPRRTAERLEGRLEVYPVPGLTLDWRSRTWGWTTTTRPQVPPPQ
jgi:hypothetical protein